MKNILIIIALIGVLNAQSREALLIGNYSYKHIDVLENPTQSIKNLKKALIKLGFNVKDVYDLDSENLSAEVMYFRDRLNRDSIGFFYYSGHGCQLSNQSYLIPTNVNTKEPSKIKYHALSINELLDNLEQSKNRVNMLFLDACRDVPIGSRGGTKGLGQINNTPKGSLIVYATESGKTAQDNSLFIKELTKSIQQPNKKIWEIGNYLSNTIARKTGDKQIPEMFSKRLPSGLMLLSSDIDELQDIVIKKEKTPKPNIHKSKWITPTNAICKANGGVIYKGTCRTVWESAKKICKRSKGRLPTINELKRIIKDCGGEIKDNDSPEWKRNRDNPYYQSCYKSKGFKYKYYWSSNIYNSDYAWLVNFNNGNFGYKGYKYYVRCVIDGQ